jgi:hypothetical protein
MPAAVDGSKQIQPFIADLTYVHRLATSNPCALDTSESTCPIAAHSAGFNDKWSCDELRSRAPASSPGGDIADVELQVPAHTWQDKSAGK